MCNMIFQEQRSASDISIEELWNINNISIEEQSDIEDILTEDNSENIINYIMTRDEELVLWKDMVNLYINKFELTKTICDMINLEKKFAKAHVKLSVSALCITKQIAGINFNQLLDNDKQTTTFIAKLEYQQDMAMTLSYNICAKRKYIKNQIKFKNNLLINLRNIEYNFVNNYAGTDFIIKLNYASEFALIRIKMKNQIVQSIRKKGVEEIHVTSKQLAELMITTPYWEWSKHADYKLDIYNDYATLYTINLLCKLRKDC